MSSRPSPRNEKGRDADAGPGHHRSVAGPVTEIPNRQGKFETGWVDGGVYVPVARAAPVDASVRERAADPRVLDSLSGRLKGGSPAGEPPPAGLGDGLSPSPPDAAFSRSYFDAVARALEAFGLRRSISRLYCAALVAGRASPLELIVKAQVRRATGYRGLERLRRMELVVPVTHRPLRLEAVPLARFLDRSASALKDEIDLHREIREAAVEELSLPGLVREATAPGLFGAGEVAGVLHHSLAQARKDLLVAPVLRGFSSETRTVLRQALQDALARGVRVRLLAPYESAYQRIFSGSPMGGGTQPHFLVRLSEPAFFHLYVIDSVRAIRFFVRSTPSERPAGSLGLVSERRAFVQAQEQRFRVLWSEAPALEISGTGRRGEPRPI